jgi:Fe/S biogenesis protein NfuA
MLTITESAQEYLAELLGKQDDALGVRVFINQPGTPRAETCIAYCREGDIKDSDVEHRFDHLTAWFDGRSVPFLEDALVDYAKDRMGGQLTIKRRTPRCRGSAMTAPSRTASTTCCTTRSTRPLRRTAARCHWSKLTEDNYAVLQFGGGCQGAAPWISPSRTASRRPCCQLPELKPAYVT